MRVGAVQTADAARRLTPPSNDVSPNESPVPSIVAAGPSTPAAAVRIAPDTAAPDAQLSRRTLAQLRCVLVPLISCGRRTHGRPRPPNGDGARVGDGGRDGDDARDGEREPRDSGREPLDPGGGLARAEPNDAASSSSATAAAAAIVALASASCSASTP